MRLHPPGGRMELFVWTEVFGLRLWFFFFNLFFNWRIIALQQLWFLSSCNFHSLFTVRYHSLGWIDRDVSKKPHPLVLSSEFHLVYKLSFFALKRLMKVLGAPVGGLHLLVGLFFEAQDIFPLCVFCKNADRNHWINNFNVCHFIQHYALKLVSENIKFFVPLSSSEGFVVFIHDGSLLEVLVGMWAVFFERRDMPHALKGCQFILCWPQSVQGGLMVMAYLSGRIKEREAIQEKS